MRGFEDAWSVWSVNIVRQSPNATVIKINDKKTRDYLSITHPVSQHFVDLGATDAKTLQQI